MITRQCLLCSKGFLTYPCRLRRGDGKYCSSTCADKSRRKVKERPTKDELVALLDYHTFAETGKMFGVTGRTIKNWAKSYDLDLTIFC